MERKKRMRGIGDIGEPPSTEPSTPTPCCSKEVDNNSRIEIGGSIDRMCDILEMRTNLAYKNNDTAPKFANAMTLVDRNPDIPADSSVYFYALDMLHDPENREVFCSFPTDARRSAWMMVASIIPKRGDYPNLKRQWLPEMLSKGHEHQHEENQQDQDDQNNDRADQDV
ncbi:hypothetical protein QJS10_CPA16g01008 [Acorus calamus]|uniref:Uncharacterized protein n=1 Tax=Acorus calamus TaxID=4465 RepID=A0AAV9CZY8_ACOCL|nr:hypothetical protein QJS10_CPA16g01008 [Acorus calamus]